MEALKAIEHLAWSFHSGTFLHAIKAVTAAHRVVVLLIAGVIAGIGGLLLKRLRGFGGGEISEALWLQDGRLAFWPALGRGTLSIVIVALGASLGREAAPQLAGGAFAGRLSEWFQVPRWQPPRRGLRSRRGEGSRLRRAPRRRAVRARGPARWATSSTLADQVELAELSRRPRRIRALPHAEPARRWSQRSVAIESVASPSCHS